MPTLTHESPRTLPARKVDQFADTMQRVRNMITMAIGCIKELNAQAVVKYKAPGMRIIIGEVLCCLGTAKKIAGIEPSAFNVTEL